MQATVIASKVLKAVREEVRSLPKLKAHDIPNVPKVVGKAMESGSQIARKSAKPTRLEGFGKGTGEFAGHKDSRGVCGIEDEGSDFLEAEWRTRLWRTRRIRQNHVGRGATCSTVCGDHRHQMASYPHADLEESDRNRLVTGQDDTQVADTRQC